MATVCTAFSRLPGVGNVTVFGQGTVFGRDVVAFQQLSQLGVAIARQVEPNHHLAIDIGEIAQRRRPRHKALRQFVRVQA